MKIMKSFFEYLISWILLLTIVAGSVNRTNLSGWNNYKFYNGVTLRQIIKDDSEEEFRIQIFEKNLNQIKKHNRYSRTKMSKAYFKMGPNHLAHLTYDEINTKYNAEMNMSEIISMAKIINERTILEFNKNSTRKSQARNKNIIKAVNWQKGGFLSPVTDQGGCGSCYAFATSWAVESAYAIKNNVRFGVNEFSKQQLVDCTYYDHIDKNNIAYNNIGCLGGNIYRTMLYIYNNGLELEADYPYISGNTPANNGKVQLCQYSSRKFALKIRNFYGINFRDVQEMKRVLQQQPIIAYFYASNDFYFYKSGIYTTRNCGKDNCGRVNHAILVVGYGIENGVPYWLCKNSWGSNWGENGFFRVEMNKNMCCVEAYGMYPVL